MQARLDGKLALLYTLLVLQILIVVIYVASTPPPEIFASTTRDSVSFVKNEIPQIRHAARLNRERHSEYKTIDGRISLEDVKTRRLFQMYNRTICWKAGVNDHRMRSIEAPERCVCNQGWHGSDCGQPEVVWRAIMASKQNVKLKRRRTTRRLVHTFCVDDYNSAIAEAIVEELYGVVDFFVICDFSNAEDNFRHKLSKGLLRAEQRKILYVNVELKARKPTRTIAKYIWDKVHGVVDNLRDEDIYVTTEPEQVLNSRALMFLKVYDGWPQPIGFRLRWSVFGFFWQHPLKTSIMIGACTVSLMREAYRTNSIILPRELGVEVGERDALGLVIGDLNHYGGWYCYLCQDPANIIASLRRTTKSAEALRAKTIDVPYVEDLIGTGQWLDGKTNLLRAYRTRDPYFAPETVLNNTWKYDWLVENFYAKLDYY